MKGTDNVVVFPGNKSLTIEEITQNITETRRDYVETVLLGPMISNIYGLIQMFNLDVNNEELNKDNALIVEAIRSMVLKLHDIEHPLQEIADKVFDLISEGQYSIDYDRFIIREVEEG